ncbi:MAG: phage major capsid protein, partial [bacterium]
MDPLERLRTERAAASERMTEILDGAEAEERDLTDEEREEFDQLEERCQKLKEDEERVEAAKEAKASLAASRGTIAGRQTAGKGSSEPASTIHAEHRDARGYPQKFTGEAGPSICVRKFLAGDQELANRVVGLHRAIVNADRAEARALSEGVGSEGGYLVPEEFAQDIVEKVGQETPLANREFMRIIPMTRDVMNV